MEFTQTRPLYGIAAVSAALLLVGCSNAQPVGTHVYRVPAKHLIAKSSYPFFLPPPKDEGFIFILNPDAPRPEQRNVLVRERATVCAQAKGTPAHVNSTICTPHLVEWRGLPWVRRGDEASWTYSPEAASGSPAPFVSCFAMQMAGHPGLCRATLPADDLALTIDLNADELPQLERRYEQAVSALRTWEQ